MTAEPSPNPNSRVLLSSTRDRFGVCKASVHWRLTDHDYTHVRRSLDLFAQDVRALQLGAVDVEDAERWAIRGTYHHMGTTRMHNDPARGVVDANCRVHGVDNLYVAGSSVFPTAGTGTPPLMILSLALRLADHLHGRIASLTMPIHTHALAGHSRSSEQVLAESARRGRTASNV